MTVLDATDGAVTSMDFSREETQILAQFFFDFLNRFEAYPMSFSFQKGGYEFAGRTRNLNAIRWNDKFFDLTPLLERGELSEHTSIGGDFVVGYDYAALDRRANLLRNEVGLAIFDTANHGYDAFFLAERIRGILLSVLDTHIRQGKVIRNQLFEEINELLKGPLTQSMVQRTNPTRASRTKGAVGIFGQFHTTTGSFNFVCTGMPVFYYEHRRNQFFYLEPSSGPPLGFFSNDEAFYKPYVPHHITLHPGDYLILSSDGCYDFEDAERDHPWFGAPQNGLREYRYEPNQSMEIMQRFQSRQIDPNQLPMKDDNSLLGFTHYLESLIHSDLSASQTIDRVFDHLKSVPGYPMDDKSMVVIKAGSA